jgi:hypothetical protein
METIRQNEFEAKPGWRATIKRRDGIYFIIAGQGQWQGKFYEYPDDWFSRFGVGPALETEIDAKTLRADLEVGKIVLLRGALP